MGALSPDLVQQIEDMIPDSSSTNLSGSIGDVEKQDCFNGLLGRWIHQTCWEKILIWMLFVNQGMNLAYDAMYGAGQNVIRRLFPDMTLLHCENNPGFHGQAPEPIDKNLQMNFGDWLNNEEILSVVWSQMAMQIGLECMMEREILWIHITLFVCWSIICTNTKEFVGKFVQLSVLHQRWKKLCKHYGLDFETVKISSEIHLSDHGHWRDVLLGGEESGGIAIKGHIPERDGIWMGLVIWEFMAKSGKRNFLN